MLHHNRLAHSGGVSAACLRRQVSVRHASAEPQRPEPLAPLATAAAGTAGDAACLLPSRPAAPRDVRLPASAAAIAPAGPPARAGRPLQYKACPSRQPRPRASAQLRGSPRRPSAAQAGVTQAGRRRMPARHRPWPRHHESSGAGSRRPDPGHQSGGLGCTDRRLLVIPDGKPHARRLASSPAPTCPPHAHGRLRHADDPAPLPQPPAGGAAAASLTSAGRL